MRLVNHFLFLTQFALFSWITPLLFIPFSLIHNIFDRNTNYWYYNYCLLFRYLGVNIKYVTDVKRINKGFFLANHRTWADFFIDILLSESAIVGRCAAFAAVLPGSILGYLDGRTILMDRSKSRKETFDNILDHLHTDGAFTKRIMFFPEGTRKKHLQLESVDQTKSMLKPGLLKSIYEYKKLPVQLQISKNKELVANESIIQSVYGTTIFTSLSEPIEPAKFESFDDFYNEICVVWTKQFNETMDSRMI